MLRSFSRNAIKNTSSTARRFQSQTAKSALAEKMLIADGKKFLANSSTPTFNENLSKVKHLKELKEYTYKIQHSFKHSPEFEEELKLQSGLASLYYRLRLNEYPGLVKHYQLAKCLNCKNSEVATYDNEKYAEIGLNALKTHILTRLYLKFPRLPSNISSELAKQFLSHQNLYNVGLTQFGLELNDKTLLDSFLANDDAYEYYGKVNSLYNFVNKKNADGVVQVVASCEGSDETKVPVEYQSMSTATLALFGLLNKEVPQLFELFARDLFNVEEVPVQKTLSINSSTSVLREVMSAENMPTRVYKLLAETGRKTSNAVYVVGAFTEEGEKLGEGYGSSINEARRRSALDAIIKYYSYSPTLKRGDIFFGKGDLHA